MPLVVKGNLIGYLAVFNKKNEEFTEQDRRLLSIIGSQSAQILENARLLEEEKTLIGLKEELKLASQIQRKLLPDHPPQLTGFQVFAINIPAKSVGGDYYDFLSLSNNRLAFCVGDITGKGMPAAMLMANLQATFRSQILVDEECAICMKRINTLLYRNTESTKFATMFYGILTPETGILNYANAGHDTPILFRADGQPLSLETTGLILGIFDDSDYTNASVQLSAGDLLLLYSDGITEAMDPDLEMYGVDRLRELVQVNRERPVSEIGELILQDIITHAKNAVQSDDITLLLLKKD